MLRTVVFLLAGAAALLSARAEGDSARILRDIPYYPESAYTNDFMSRYARLDLRLPAGATNFATVVTFHGGGLVRGFRGDFFKVRGRDDIACVSAGYRLLTNATPSECVGDAAAAVAWTLKHIAEYGGDPKKVFVTGYSGGGYLTLMVGMDPKWLKPHGYRPQQLAGLFPSTGQTSTHFTIRKMTGDDTPTYITKVDEWAPLFYAGEKELPPIALMTGGRTDNEMPCRVEENEFLAISLKKCGHKNIEFHETEGSHGGGVEPSTYFLRDFVMKYSDAGGVGRFADGEKVAFLGDSITHGGGFVVYLQLYQSLRHPGSDTRLVNFGIGGDTAAGGVGRLDWDVIKGFNPDRVFVMFGMNDVGRNLYKAVEPKDEKEAKLRAERLDAYAANETRLAEMIKQKGIKPVFMTPTPFDQYTDFAFDNIAGCNEPGLSTCADIVRQIAAERHLGVIDLHRQLTDIVKKNPEMHFCRDRVHPGSTGHLLIAAEILDAMGVSPLVAQVAIDAKEGRSYPRRNKEKKPETKNAVVAKYVTKGLGGVAFTYAPKALPFPALDEYREAEKFYPLTERFNREIFIVTGLDEGAYDLAFDGVKVGTFTAAEFAKGVNVALLDTPNQLRAREVAKVAQELRSLEGAKRNYYLIVRKLHDAKIDPKDFAASDAFVEKWLADSEARKAPALKTYRNWVKSYRAYREKLGEQKFSESNLRARINAVRPAVSRVTIIPTR
mgnify:CR=1 FL=1